MKILFITPGLKTPHGGYRVILEVATRLQAFGHRIFIHSLAKDDCHDWYPLSPGVDLQPEYQPDGMDILVLCSPHSMHLLQRPDVPPRVVLFCQMLEHLFNPGNRQWQERCGQFYASRYPLIAISEWNIREIRKSKPPASPIHYLGNGVNLDHFPIDNSPKDGKTVLVEGWQSNNPTKDPNEIGPKVAARLREEGYTILAYGAKPITNFTHVPHAYFQRPDLDQLNKLYQCATILLKASRYDARACAPVEAMTKGTVTARAIMAGDDDLTPQNSLRTPYEEEALYFIAKKLLTEVELRETLAWNCLQHVQKFTWDYYLPQYHAALMGHEERVSTVIVAIVYKEPEWSQTKDCVEATGVPVVYVERHPAGVGSLTEAFNRGVEEALHKYPQAKNLWLVTNVTFARDTLAKLEGALASGSTFGIIHPTFESDHAFCRRVPGLKGLQPVPFVELTAPLIRRTVLDLVGPFDEKMPYWGQDLDYGMRARAAGFLIGVDQATAVNHTYVRHLYSRSGQEVTRRRVALRKASDNATRARLNEKYGPDWGVLTGRHPS